MDKVHKGICAACGKTMEVVTVASGDRSAEVCEGCAKKLNISPDDFLSKYAKQKKAGFFESLFSAFAPKPKPAQPAIAQPKKAEETPQVVRETRPSSKFGENAMETSIDQFLDLVKEQRKIELGKAASILCTKADMVEKWAMMLDRKGLIKLVYPQNPLQNRYVTVVDEAKQK